MSTTFKEKVAKSFFENVIQGTGDGGISKAYGGVVDSAANLIGKATGRTADNSYMTDAQRRAVSGHRSRMKALYPPSASKPKKRSGATPEMMRGFAGPLGDMGPPMPSAPNNLRGPEGPMTLKQFQRANNLRPDGAIGPRTRAVIDRNADASMEPWRKRIRAGLQKFKDEARRERYRDGLDRIQARVSQENVARDILRKSNQSWARNESGDSANMAAFRARQRADRNNPVERMNALQLAKIRAAIAGGGAASVNTPAGRAPGT